MRGQVVQIDSMHLFRILINSSISPAVKLFLLFSLAWREVFLIYVMYPAQVLFESSYRVQDLVSGTCDHPSLKINVIFNLIEIS